MRSKIKTRIKLDVEVNVDVEFDERSGEVAIVGAHIDPAQNVLTPRQIYRSITPGRNHSSCENDGWKIYPDFPELSL